MTSEYTIHDTLYYVETQDFVVEGFHNFWGFASDKTKKKYGFRTRLNPDNTMDIYSKDGTRLCTVAEPVTGMISVLWMRSVQALQAIEQVLIRLEKENEIGQDTEQ